MQGQMLWFNEARDQGFIMTDEGERLAVPGPGFAGEERPVGRCARKIVSFEVDDSNDTRQAQNVIFVPDVPVRRARRRSAGRAVRH